MNVERLFPGGTGRGYAPTRLVDEDEEGATMTSDEDFSLTDGQYDPATDPFEQEDDDPEMPPDDDPGWTHYAPDRDALIAFASSPPGTWAYEGYGTGGYILSAAGLNSTVRFHVHEQSGTPPWTFGSMWVEGVNGLSVNINEDVPSKDGLRAAVAGHLTAIQADMRNRG